LLCLFAAASAGEPGGRAAASSGHVSGNMASWQREAILANPAGLTRSVAWTLRHDLASRLTDVIETPPSSSAVQAA
jgi:hypothetical protein